MSAALYCGIVAALAAVLMLVLWLRERRARQHANQALGAAHAAGEAAGALIAELRDQHKHDQAMLGLREIQLSGKLTWVPGCAPEPIKPLDDLPVWFAMDGGVICGAVVLEERITSTDPEAPPVERWRAYGRLQAARAPTPQPGGVQWSLNVGPLERAKQEVERLNRELNSYERQRAARGA